MKNTKRSIIFLVLLLVALTWAGASSWSISAELGLPSTLGVTYSAGRFDGEFKIHSSFGLGGFLSYSFIDKASDADMTASEKISYGNSLIQGLSLGFSYKVLNTDVIDFYLGTDAVYLHASSIEGVISHFTTGDTALFNVNVKLGFDITEHNNVFIKTGFPLLAYLNYGGDENNTNYCAFDFWAFLPTAIVQAEEGNYVDVEAKTLAMIFAALDFKIGYTYRF